MMRFLIAAALIVLAPALAPAQEPSEDELSEHAEVCRKHQLRDRLSPPGTPKYVPGYENCEAIMAAWNKTVRAKAEREAEEKRKRDLQRLNDAAKKLPPVPPR